MKKVLILYGAYGGGHLSAAKSIHSYIQENYTDVEVELLDCVKYVNKYIEKISSKAYEEMAKVAPWAWGKIYYNSENGTLAKISNTSNRFMSVKLNKYLREFNPDLIISTHPFGNNMCSYLKKKGRLGCRIATVLTDYAIHSQWLENHEYIDNFFVAHDGMRTELIDLGISENKIFTTGIPVSERFFIKFDKSEVLNEFNLKDNLKTILFFAGGEFGLSQNSTFDIFDNLINNFNNIQVIAVAGRNEKMKKLFDNIVEENNLHDTIKVLPFTNKVPELMSISNLIITKPGGLTTTESLISGLPILAINPIPGQEEQNAQFIVSHNVGTWLKKNDDISLALDNFINDDELLKIRKENALKLAKMFSTKNICEVLLG